MTHIKHILAGITLCAAMTITLASCQKEEPIQAHMELSLPGTTDLYVYKGQTFSLSFYVTGTLADPVMVDTQASSGIRDFRVTGDAGYTSVTVCGVLEVDDAVFSIKVSSGAALSRSVTVNVHSVRASITGIPDNGGFAGGGAEETLALNIETNLPEDRWGEIEVCSDAGWLTLVRSGLSLSASMAANGERRARSCALTLKAGALGTVEYTVRQDWETSLEPCRPDVVGFADKAFKSAMLGIADTDGDGEVSLVEARAVTEIVIPGMGVRDLTGLEEFCNVWKFEAAGNDIRDAGVLSELHLLYWLDIRDNPDLEWFDVSGCTVYFERCWFDTTDKLRYRCHVRQIDVTYDCDREYSCADLVWDTRKSTDYSMDGEVYAIQRHTKGDGGKVIVLSGIGWLDVDHKDGSFDRCMRNSMEMFLDIWPAVKANREYLDIYVMRHVTESRDLFVYPREDHGKEYARELGRQWSQYRTSLENKMLSIIDNENIEHILPIEVDIHPHANSNTMSGWSAFYPDNDYRHSSVAVFTRLAMFGSSYTEANLSLSLAIDYLGPSDEPGTFFKL